MLRPELIYSILEPASRALQRVFSVYQSDGEKRRKDFDMKFLEGKKTHSTNFIYSQCPIRFCTSYMRI